MDKVEKPYWKIRYDLPYTPPDPIYIIINGIFLYNTHSVKFPYHILYDVYNVYK